MSNALIYSHIIRGEGSRRPGYEALNELVQPYGAGRAVGIGLHGYQM